MEAQAAHSQMLRKLLYCFARGYRLRRPMPGGASDGALLLRNFGTANLLASLPYVSVAPSLFLSCAA